MQRIFKFRNPESILRFFLISNLCTYNKSKTFFLEIIKYFKIIFYVNILISQKIVPYKELFVRSFGNYFILVRVKSS